MSVELRASIEVYNNELHALYRMSLMSMSGRLVHIAFAKKKNVPRLIGWASAGAMPPLEQRLVRARRTTDEEDSCKSASDQLISCLLQL